MFVRKEGGQIVGIVKYILDPNNSRQLTDEEKDMIKKAEAMPVTFDEDCPESTDEMLAKFRKVGERR